MRLKVTLKQLRLDPARVLARRGLGAGGEAERALAGALRARSEPYVPRDTGALIRSARVEQSAGGTCLRYGVPYARLQYEGVAPSGRALRYQGAPQRGAAWDRRAIAEHPGALAAALARAIQKKEEGA